MPSRFAPTVVATADYKAAGDPRLGFYRRFSVSTTEAYPVGTVSIRGVNSGVLTVDSQAAARLLATNAHMVAMANTRSTVRSDANVVLTFSVTDAGSTTKTATATFAPAPFANIQANVFPVGSASDILVTGDAKVKALLSLTSVVCAATSRGSEFTLFAMPDTTDFVELIGASDFSGGFETPAPVSIADGDDPAKWVVPGRGGTPGFQVTAKDFGARDAWAAYAGDPVTLLVAIYAHNDVQVENNYYLGAQFAVDRSMPEGNAEASMRINGMARDILIMVPPVS